MHTHIDLIDRQYRTVLRETVPRTTGFCTDEVPLLALPFGRQKVSSVVLFNRTAF